MRTSSRRRRLAGIVATVCVVVLAALFGVLLFQMPKATRTAQATQVPTLPFANPTATPTPEPLPGNDWTQYRYDVVGTGANPEDLITTANVAHLTTRWIDGGMFGGHSFESTPAVYHGVIYYANGDSLYAFELATGKLLWHYDDNPPGKLPQISSSVAIDPTTAMAYYGTPDARVFAVSILTHERIWQQSLGNPSKGAYIWSSPLLVNGKIYIGLASHDDHPCVRGGAFALDPATGRTIWVHYMVPAAELGGGIWSSMIADSDDHAVIVTTGNPCDGPPNTGTQGGSSDADQNAIMALNWDTGATIWRYTAIAYDVGQDLDFGEGAVLYAFGGKEYIVAGNKQGVVYALTPPASGSHPRLAWSVRLAVSGAYPRGGIFTPPTYRDGKVFIAGGPTPDGACPQGALFALKADTGVVLWRACTPIQVVSPPSTTGGVVFVAETKLVAAYSAATGKQLWHAALNGTVYGGVAIAHGYVLLGTGSGASRVYCFGLPTTG